MSTRPERGAGGCGIGKPHKISALTYVIPFGRYVGSRRVTPEADEVLVGREGHRAYFIELLISAGREGAFLVTGRRGAGKTSFVDHCIAEYEASIFKRFLRHNVGRAFWDRAFVLLFWTALLVGGVLLSELAQLLVPLTSPGPHRMLIWLVFVPIGVILLFPCVYARAVLEVLFEPSRGRAKGSRHPTVVASATVLVAGALLWFLPGLSSPAWSASALCFLLSALYLAVQALSLVPSKSKLHRPSSTSRRVWRRIRRLKPSLSRWLLRWIHGSGLLRWRVLARIYLPALGLLTVVGWILAESLNPVWSLKESLAINLQASAAMLAGGLFLRGWYQRRGAQALLPRSKKSDPVRQALRRGSLNYLWPGGLLFLATLPVSMWLGDYQRPHEAFLSGLLALGAAAVMVFLGGWRLETSWNREGADRLLFRLRESGIGLNWRREALDPLLFRPRVRLILGVGALISLVVALQLAQPILHLVIARTVNPVAAALDSGETAAQATDPIPAGTVLGRVPFSLARVPGLEEVSEESDDTLTGSCVFWRRSETLGWLGLILLALLLLHFIQYEWVIRPHVNIREDGLLDPTGRAPWEDRDSLGGAMAGRWRPHRKVAELTLPWTVYRHWLPSMVVSVNLGFDSRLGPEQIIQAMLVGLRDVYHRTFTSWTAGPANVGRFGAGLILLMLVTLAGDVWFELPKGDEVAEWMVAAREERRLDVEAGRPRSFAAEKSSACGMLASTREVRPTIFPDLICRIGEGWLNVLYLNLAPEQLGEVSSIETSDPQRRERAAGQDPSGAADRLVLYTLLPYRDRASEPDEDPVLQEIASDWDRLLPSGIHFQIYHLLLLIGFLVAGRWAVKKLPLLPYGRNVQRIDDLLDGMTARTRLTHRPTLWEPARWIYNLVADRVRETEREPLDPRTVELAFLQILAEIQRGGFRMPGIARSHLNMPSPEITFVFDELDKLGTRLDPEDEDPSTLATELRVHQAEQERALKLRGLLSDLKNILSSAPARFIFIGGRNLHDEWLADQTARQPLLTNIFIAEVYLPSLLTDHARERHAQGAAAHPRRRLGLHTRIEEFLSLQHRRATRLYKEWALKGWRPSFALPPAPLSQERFAADLPKPPTSELQVHPCRADGNCTPLRDEEKEILIRDFIDFLTLRSMGNPKRLKELLASFIRPVGQVVKEPLRWQLPCRHVIRLRDVEVFRIQLIGSIYRHLAGAFEERMIQRDDKLATSIFFLSDFLFKFHRRSFSWSNLERVDELAHIHRAPDMREVQEEMVDLFSERFLHRVLNGMYSFRFRSDVAREVEYLSQRSAAEMAALNFTLDESQILKAIYQHSVERREQKEGPNSGLVAGLGELYEFDQEYETARHHYRRAIDLLDEKLCKRTGSAASIRSLLLGEHAGMEDARIFLPWGEARLRLMLQIGMTFEIARNIEHAVTEYRAARTLARALVRACLALDREEMVWLWASPRREEVSRGRLHTLKHLSILLQPIYAEAWASEKVTGTIDTSVMLVESALWELRKLLPFLKRPRVHESQDPTKAAHANLALTASQLHNKAGDLYFFKGRQPVRWKRMIESSFWPRDQQTDRPTDGYLLRAHHHYAVSLHEIRRYTYHRVESSKYRLSLAAKAHERTLIGEALPDFVWRALASSLNDMAEATLARVSLFGVVRSLAGAIPAGVDGGPALHDQVLRWLELPDGEANGFRELTVDLDADRTISLGELTNWFGTWVHLVPGEVGVGLENAAERKDYEDSRLPLVRFEGPNDPVIRLLVSVHLCRVGAGFFARAGYLEDGARELLQVCWIVNRMLWWLRAADRLRALPSPRRGPDQAGRGEVYSRIRHETGQLDSAVFGAGEAEPHGWAPRLLLHLGGFAVDVLERADRLFRESRHRLADRGSRNLLGDVIPPDALTLACSLGLWLEATPNEGWRALGYDTPREGWKMLGGYRRVLMGRLRRLVESWLGQPPTQGGFRETLRHSLERHRFPLLNRLNGLEVLVDDFVLNRWTTASPQLGDDFAAAYTHLEELLELNEQYAAPLHFTPHQSGTTCALFWLRWALDGPSPQDEPERTFRDRLFHTAQRDLRVSEEMFSLQRAFYETISDLYYLYDDFNDRQIHFKHALQMAGAELTTLLRRLLKVAGEAPP